MTNEIKRLKKKIATLENEAVGAILYDLSAELNVEFNLKLLKIRYLEELKKLEQDIPKYKQIQLF